MLTHSGYVNQPMLHTVWVVFCITLGSRHSAANAGDHWMPDGVLASFAISTDGQLVHMPITVDNTRRTFLLDTGFTSMMFDESLVANLERLEPDGVLRTQGSRLSVPRYRAPTMAIQDAALDWIDEVGSLNVKPLAQASESDFEGVVGMNALRRFVLHLDFDNGVALLCDPQGASGPPGSSVPLELNRYLTPCIMVQLPGGIHKAFEIDTGFNETAQVETDLFDSLKRSGGIAGTGVWSEFTNADNSRKAVEKGRCAEMDVGNRSHKGLIVTPGKTNLLGLSFLCRYRVTFDFVNERLYLDPSKRFGVRDRRDSDGIIVNDKKAIRYIAKESVGDQVGFRVSDEILTIDGKDVTRISRMSINRMLGFPRAANMPLTVRRGDKVIELVIPGG